MGTQYYNKEDVKVGLRTDGNEYQLSLEYSGESYVGYYHIDKGTIYTDPSPITERQLLYPYVTEPLKESRKYNIIKKQKTPTHIAPSFHLPKPTTDDISQGWILRFFVQRRPDRIITEVNRDQFDLVGADIDEALYKRASIRWKISGTDISIKFINSGKLQTMDNTMPGISDYLNNLLEFSEYSPVWAKQ